MFKLDLKIITWLDIENNVCKKKLLNINAVYYNVCKTEIHKILHIICGFISL